MAQIRKRTRPAGKDIPKNRPRPKRRNDVHVRIPKDHIKQILEDEGKRMDCAHFLDH